MHSDRLKKLRARMADSRIGALLITKLPNIFYMTGFTGSTAVVVVTMDACDILVDSRYTLQARGECPASVVTEVSGKSLAKAAIELVNNAKPDAMGFEADSVTVTTHRQLKKYLDSGIGMRSTTGFVEKLRIVKDQDEIALIRKSSEISDATFKTILAEIKPGLTERDVALLIDTNLRRLGADREAFETIAAAGPNSARPHHCPTDAVLQKGQLLKMDFGARRMRYNSDITRTICLGKPTPKQQEVYQIVLDALLKATDAIAPGKTGKEIDAIARDYITSKGYGSNFGHGLGHGLGIDVHDGPGFSGTSDLVLEAGMVITVEPGIYIEGWGGVRVEDDIVVTETGVEVLTAAPKMSLLTR